MPLTDDERRAMSPQLDGTVESPLLPDGDPKKSPEIDPRAELVGEVDYVQGGLLGVGAQPEYERGAEIELAQKDPTYLNSLREGNQSAADLFLNATVQGVAGGALTAAETLSYLGDMTNTVGALVGAEAAESNALRDFVKENQEALREAYPTFKRNPDKMLDFSDPGTYATMWTELLRSGIGFGISGGAVGKGVQALGNLSKGSRLASIFGNRTAQLWTAGALQNMTEGKMIALDAFDKGVKEDMVLVDQKLGQETAQYAALLQEFMAKPDNLEEVNGRIVIKGTDMTPQEWYNNSFGAYLEGVGRQRVDMEEEVRRVRGEQTNKIMALNSMLVFSEAAQLKALFRGGTSVRREAMRSATQRVKEAVGTPVGRRTIAGLAGREAVQEGAQEILAAETGYQAQRELGLVKEKDIMDRFGDYVTSDQFIMATMLGAMGGPFQSVVTGMTGSAMDAVTGRGQARDEYNAALEADQGKTKALLEDYLQTNFKTSAEDYTQRVQATLRGDEHTAESIQEESMSDLAYRSMSNGTLNTLEESLSDLEETAGQDEGIDTDQTQRLRDLRASLPQYERLFQKAHRQSTNRKGETDVSTRKVYYDLLSRAEIARQHKEQLQNEAATNNAQAVEYINSQIVAQDEKISSVDTEVTNAEQDLKALEQTLAKLQSKKTNTQKAFSRKKQSNSIFDQISVRALEKVIKDTESKIADTEEKVRQATGERNKVIAEGKVSKERAQRNKRHLEAEPEYVEAQEKKNQALEFETLESLYNNTYRQALSNKKELSDEQQKLFDQLQQREDAKLLESALKTEDTEAVQAAEEAIPEVQATPEQQAEQEQQKDRDFQKQVDGIDPADMKTEDPEAKRREPDTQKVIDDTVNAGNAETVEEAVYETLPDLRRRVLNGQVKPPKGISKEEFADILGEVISKGEVQHPRTTPKPTVEEVSNVNVDTSENWQEESVRDENDNVRDNNAGDAESTGYEPTLSSPNAVAYTSNLENASERMRRFARYVEDPAIDLTTHSVRYEIETDESIFGKAQDAVGTPAQRKAIENYNKYRQDKTALTNKQKADMWLNLPLRMILVDAQGNDVRENGELVYGHVHHRSYRGWATANNEALEAAVEDFQNNKKPAIAQALAEGKKVTAKITSQRSGYANHRYTYTYGGRQYTRNTQDETQDKQYRDRQRKASDLEAVPNSLLNVLDGNKLVLGVGNTEGDITFFDDNGEPDTAATGQTRTPDRLYFRVQTAKGSYRWYAAYIRQRTRQEAALYDAAQQPGATMEDLKSQFSNEVDLVSRAYNKEADIQDVLEFYQPVGDNKLRVDTGKLGQEAYINALTEGESPILYTSLHKLDTAGRENNQRVFIQPTIVVDTEYKVNDISSTSPEPDLKVKSNLVKTIGWVQEQLKDSKAVGALGAILRLNSRAEVGAFTSGMQHMADREFEADGKYQKAFDDVIQLLTGKEQSKDLAYIYSIYSSFVRNGGKESDFKGLTRTTRDTFKTIYEIENSIFRNKSLADTFTNMALGQKFQENPPADEAYTDDQKDQAAKDTLSSEIQEKSDPDFKPEPVTDVKAAAVKAPDTQKRKQQIANMNAPDMMKAATGRYSTTALRDAADALSAEMAQLDLQKVITDIPSAIEQAIDRAINRTAGKSKARDAILRNTKNLFSRSKKEAQVPFIRHYRELLANAYAEQENVTEEVKNIPPAQVERPVSPPDKKEGSDVDNSKQQPQPPVSNPTEDVANNEDTYPQNQPKNVEDTASELKNNGEALETTDKIEDNQEDPTTVADTVPEWVPAVFRMIRAKLNHKRPDVQLSGDDAVYQENMDFMLDLNLETQEDWRRVNEMYKFINDNKEAVAAQINGTDFLRAFRELNQVATNLLGTVPQNTPSFEMLSRLLLSGVGRHYLMGAEDMAALKSVNKWMGQYFTEEIANLDSTATLLAADLLGDYYYSSEEGAKQLRNLARKDFTSRVGGGFFVRADRGTKHPSVIGYNNDGSPVFATYQKNFDRVHKFESTRKREDGQWTATYIPLRVEEKPFTEVLNSVEDTSSQYMEDVPVRTEIPYVKVGDEVVADYKASDTVFEGEPTLANFEEFTTNVTYSNGNSKPVTFRVREGQLEVRRDDATDPSWARAQPHHIEAYIQYMSKEYKRKCK